MKLSEVKTKKEPKLVKGFMAVTSSEMDSDDIHDLDMSVHVVAGDAESDHLYELLEKETDGTDSYVEGPFEIDGHFMVVVADHRVDLEDLTWLAFDKDRDAAYKRAGEKLEEYGFESDVAMLSV